METVVIHGAAGVLGLLATPLITSDSAQQSLYGVGWALLAALAITLWASGCSFVLFGVLRFAGHLPSTKEMHPVIGTKDEMEKMNNTKENTIEDAQNKNSV